MTLGEKIQDLRRRNAMSQDVLAEKLEVSRQAVSKWERDEAMPETDKIVRIAQLFSVSTDYLLMKDPEMPKQQAQQPQYQTQPTKPTAGDRLEQLVRRHGYKGGYVFIAIGALLCLMALMVMLVVPSIGSLVFDKTETGEDVWNSGIYIEGDLPQDVLDQIYGQIGSGIDPDPFSGGIFGSMEDEYDQQVGQMQSAWSRGVFIVTAMFGVPVLILGIGSIILGSVVVVKGKKIASEANCG